MRKQQIRGNRVGKLQEQSLVTVLQQRREGLDVASLLDSGLGAGRVIDCLLPPKKGQ